MNKHSSTSLLLKPGLCQHTGRHYLLGSLQAEVSLVRGIQSNCIVHHDDTLGRRPRRPKGRLATPAGSPSDRMRATAGSQRTSPIASNAPLMARDAASSSVASS